MEILGKSILQGLLDGLLNVGNAIKNAVAKLGNNIVKSFKSFFGIHSPSKLMENIAAYLPEGIAIGIEANTEDVDKAIDSMNESIVDKMKQAVNVEAGKIAYTGTNGTVTQMMSAYGTTTVVNDNKLYLDGDEIYENQQKVSAKKNLQTQFGGGYSVSA